MAWQSFSTVLDTAQNHTKNTGVPTYVTLILQGDIVGGTKIS